MHGELDEVERPFVEQLTAMGWRYLAGDLDSPDGRQNIEGPVTPRSGPWGARQSASNGA